MSKKNIPDKRAIIFSKKKLLNLITNLEDIIRGLENDVKSAWNNYYQESISSPEYLREKEKIVTSLLLQTTGNSILDLGTNKGNFSFIAAEKGFSVVAIDNDEQCINSLYKKIKQENISSILALCVDITNPSPAIGFANRERSSWYDRMQADIVMALAMIHHLVIGKNIPLSMLAEYLSALAPQLIIEFVPKEDEKTQLLLQNKKDIYPDYTKEIFESSFGKCFTISSQLPVHGTNRVIYLMNSNTIQTK